MILKKPLFVTGLTVLVLIFFLFNKGETSIKTIKSKDQKKQQIALINDDLKNSEEKQDDEESYTKPASSTTENFQEEKQNISIKVSNNNVQKNKISNNEKNTETDVIVVKDKSNDTKMVNTIKSNSNFYGKANIYIGHAMMYSNSYDVTATLGLSNKYVNINNSVSKMNKNISGVLILNYNFYYKLTNFIHPFIGVDIMSKYPFSSDNEFNFKMNGDYIDSIPCYYNLDVKESVKLKEYGRVNARLGAKINFHKNFSIEPYALAGLNVTRNLSILSTINGEYSRNYGRVPKEIARESSFENSKTKINFTLGGGFDIVFADKYIVGMEYYNYRVNTGSISSYEGGNKEFSINMKREKFVNHNFLVKFGVRF